MAVLARPLPLSAEAGRGHLAMLLFSGLVAGSFSLGGLAAPHIEPLALTAVRFVLAACAVGGVAAARGVLSRRAFAAPWRFAVLGALMAVYFTMMFEGLRLAAPVSLSVVFTLTPVMAAGFGWLLMGQRTGPYTGAALGLAAAGALWVIFDADWRRVAALDLGAGEALMLVGCAAHAVYAALVPRLSRGEGALTQTLGMLVAGSAILAVIAAPDLATTPWAALPGVVWLALIYLAIASSAVSFFLVQYAGLRLPAAKVMAYTYLTPAWVILWEGALGHGWPPPWVLAGIAAVIGALLMLLRR